VRFGLTSGAYYFFRDAGIYKAVRESCGLDQTLPAGCIRQFGLGVIGTPEDAIARIEGLQRSSEGAWYLLILAHDWARGRHPRFRCSPGCAPLRAARPGGCRTGPPPRGSPMRCWRRRPARAKTKRETGWGPAAGWRFTGAAWAGRARAAPAVRGRELRQVTLGTCSMTRGPRRRRDRPRAPRSPWTSREEVGQSRRRVWRGSASSLVNNAGSTGWLR
jgi:hypothetical protein